MTDEKDYKAIGEINQAFRTYFINDVEYKDFCNKQADYFEREDRLKHCINMNDSNCIFNRKQFLKDCGINKWS